jgi:hypothetical protein
MAGIQDSDLVRVTGFPKGVNNTAPEQDLPRKGSVPQAARALVNVDLVGPSKKPRLRQGYTREIAGRFHSPMTLRGVPRLFAVADGDLGVYSESNGAITREAIIRPGVGDQPLTYAEVNGDLYWSSRRELRMLRGDDFADLPGWVDSPGVPHAAAYSTGGLAAGTYFLAMTWLDALGRESGAAGKVEVTLTAGQGIQVSHFPDAPETAVTSRIYLSPADTDELYAALELPTTATSALLGVGAGQGGKPLETLWHAPMPPCAILRYWNGRLIGATDNLLIWSEALRGALLLPDNYMRFGQTVSLLEPVGEGTEEAGVWIADHARTYWMAGSSPKAWRRVIRYDHSAVPGTSMLVRGDVLGLKDVGPEPVAFWLAQNGTFCAGLPGGTLVPLTEGRLAIPGGEVGASFFREDNGLRALITSYLSGPRNRMAIGDRASATVTRHTTP